MRVTRSASAGPGPSLARAKRHFADDVISISDSDDDDSIVEMRPSRKRKGATSSSAATKSKLAVPKTKHTGQASGPVAGPSTVSHVVDKAVQPKPTPDAKNDHAQVIAAIQAQIVAQAPPPAPAQAEPMEVDEPPNPEDIMDAALASVLEIVPDVTPEHARALCTRLYPEYKQRVHEAVLHMLFEDPNYPKVDTRKRKRSPAQDDDDSKGKGKAKEVKIDYGSKDRPFLGGPYYYQIALALLTEAFPRIPLPHIRDSIRRNNMHYAPTYLQLAEDLKADPLPFKLKNGSKGKGKAAMNYDEEIEKERAWIEAKLADEQAQADKELAEQQQQEELEASGMGIECGCCFAEYAWEKMVQCLDAHLFCMECARRSAEEAIGNRKVDLVCMDQSGCKEVFPLSEIKRFLPEKNFVLWERIKQEKSLEMAKIDGLESCPFCHYSIIIENDQEKLFRCESSECGAVSCRKCKKPDHLPKSCEEVEADKKLDVRHVIEEAMTAALTRQCPKCKNPFVKTEGCNKMTCPSCHTLSCYICREIITGYDHFSKPPPYKGPEIAGRCALWDAIEKRGHDEVAVAARQALAKYKAEHPEATDSEVDIESMLPAPPAGASVAGPAQAVGRAQVAVPPRAPPPAPVVYRAPAAPVAPNPNILAAQQRHQRRVEAALVHAERMAADLAERQRVRQIEQQARAQQLRNLAAQANMQARMQAPQVVIQAPIARPVPAPAPVPQGVHYAYPAGQAAMPVPAGHFVFQAAYAPPAPVPRQAPVPAPPPAVAPKRRARERPGWR